MFNIEKHASDTTTRLGSNADADLLNKVLPRQAMAKRWLEGCGLVWHNEAFENQVAGAGPKVIFMGPPDTNIATCKIMHDGSITPV